MFIFRKKRIYYQIEQYVKDKSKRYYVEAVRDQLELMTFVSVTEIEDIFDLNDTYISKYKMFLSKKDSEIERSETIRTIRCFVRYHKNMAARELAKTIPLLDLEAKI